MPLIVDTYNVLHTTGALPPELAGIDLHELAAMIASSRYGRQHCHLVCDGKPQRGHSGDDDGRIAIVHSGTHRTADEVIVAMIDRSSHPRQITVVSSDQQVLRAARRRRCKRIDSHRFLQQLARDLGLARRTRPPSARKPGSVLTPQQVEHEIAKFGLSADELQRIEHERTAALSAPRAPASPGAQQPISRRPPATDKRKSKAGWKDQTSSDPTQTELDRFAITPTDIAAIESERRGPRVKRDQSSTNAMVNKPVRNSEEQHPADPQGNRSWQKTTPFPNDVLADAERIAREE